MSYFNLLEGVGYTDDIDHLETAVCVQSVSCSKSTVLCFPWVCCERMSIQDRNCDTTAANQLPSCDCIGQESSEALNYHIHDQTNPLEITTSAVYLPGPGGLTQNVPDGST